MKLATDQYHLMRSFCSWHSSFLHMMRKLNLTGRFLIQRCLISPFTFLVEAASFSRKRSSSSSFSRWSCSLTLSLSACTRKTFTASSKNQRKEQEMLFYSWSRNIAVERLIIRRFSNCSYMIKVVGWRRQYKYLFVLIWFWFSVSTPTPFDNNFLQNKVEIEYAWLRRTVEDCKKLQIQVAYNLHLHNSKLQTNRVFVHILFTLSLKLFLMFPLFLFLVFLLSLLCRNSQGVFLFVVISIQKLILLLLSCKHSRLLLCFLICLLQTKNKQTYSQIFT